MFTKVIVQQDLPLQVGESDTMHDFLLQVSQGRYKGVSAGTVLVIVSDMSEEGKKQTKIFVERCVEDGTRLTLSGDLWSSDGMTLFEDAPIKQTWLGTGNVRREFPVSSAHACVQSVRKNIREDMEDRWVTNLSEDRKRFYLV